MIPVNSGDSGGNAGMYLCPFGFFHNIRSKWRNIYIKVIEDKQDNCGKHDKGRKTKVISPADCVHNLAHKGLI